MRHWPGRPIFPNLERLRAHALCRGLWRIVCSSIGPAMCHLKIVIGKQSRGHRRRLLRPWISPRGFSLVELSVLVAIIGIVAVVSAPMFISYWRPAALQGGADLTPDTSVPRRDDFAPAQE
jgi:prepilin-type N-terminal cleavage/methylation domain-containing protein